jgi:two-component sensor histidine kinase
LIHQSLSDRKNYGKINLSDYLVKLVNNILDVLGRKQVFVSFNAEGVFLDIQTATSLGLIINELVCVTPSNMLFRKNRVVELLLVLKSRAFDYQLFYGDNGVGCSSKSTRSLGLDLVFFMLVSKLRYAQRFDFEISFRMCLKE